MQTQWTPLKGGGASFMTHKLIEVNSYRVEFRASLGAKLFYLVFLLVGIGVTVATAKPLFSSGGFSFNIDTILPLLIGLVFAIVGGSLLYFGTAPIVFDKQSGFFWKGRKAPRLVFKRETIKYFAELHELHSLQLVSEYCSGKKSSYYSYELNLILKNGKRINVVDHGNLEKLREDSSTLSSFLDKPVWDAI